MQGGGLRLRPIRSYTQLFLISSRWQTDRERRD